LVGFRLASNPPEDAVHEASHRVATVDPGQFDPLGDGYPGRRPISFPHPKRNLRIEQRRRLPHQICHFQKSASQHSIILGGAIEFCDVPVDEAYLGRALAFDMRVLKIAADGNLPGNIDEPARCPIEASGNFLRAGRQAFPQSQRFHAGNGHPLTVDRIEAAQGVAKHQKARREAR